MYVFGDGSLVTKSCLTLVTLLTVTHQAPLAMGFPRQEYWSRLPFPLPGDFPDPGIELVSLASPALAGRLFSTEPLGKSSFSIGSLLIPILLYD